MPYSHSDTIIFIQRMSMPMPFRPKNQTILPQPTKPSGNPSTLPFIPGNQTILPRPKK